MARRILLIDDDADLRRLAQMRLQMAGYEVLEAPDGEAGLKLLRAEHPPVILLDLMMPKVHGYAVCQQIRGDSALRDTYIIAASAKRYPVDIRKAMEMGANAYLIKPYEMTELLEKVSEGFAKVEAQSTGTAANASGFLLRFWGTRGSIATPGPKTLRYGGNTSCVELRHGNRILMLDCGTGAREMGIALQREFGDKAFSLDLFVSHSHWDHIQGFPFFTPVYQSGNHIRIYSLRGSDKSLEKVFTGQMDGSYFPVELTDLKGSLEFHELEGPIDLDDIHVTHFGLNHPGLAVGFRFEAGGKSLVYLTDHEPYCRLSGENELNLRLDREVDEFVRGADLYIREAQFTEEEYPRKRGWGHSTWRDAVDSAHAAGVKRLCIYHHDPMHDDIALDNILAACWEHMKAKGMKFECMMASDGMELEW
ncbi:MAG TPA: response regulator [Candidatus Acidoferrales bacterium]|nr:response regulator [Candidatus Acidoferrales bacterium]